MGTRKHKLLTFLLSYMTFCYVGFTQAPDKRIIYLSDDDLNNSFNHSLLNDVFGEDNWEEFYYVSLDTTGIFSANTCMIFMEGSHDVSDEFTDFYEVYRDAAEEYVYNGGNLYINFLSVPEFSYYLGFDSIFRSSNESFNWAGTFLAETHEIYEGPFYPIINPIDFSPILGFLNSKGSFSGSNFDTLMLDTSGTQICLLKKIFGTGQIIASQFKATTDDYYSEEHLDLRRNILWHLAPCLHSQNDLGIQDLFTPDNSCNLSTEEILSVSAHNFGFANQNNYDVSFQIDDGEIFTETFTQYITAYLSDTITFSAPADFSGCGAHTVKIWTILVGDTIPQNDTLIYTITNICATETTIGLPTEICYNNDPVIANPEVGGGYWEGLGITDPDSGIFDPAIVGEGNSSVVAYTYQTAIDYTREIIPFDPPAFTDSISISLIYNDDVDTLLLPFDFVFFSNSYDVMYPASNGYIAFGAPHDTWYINIPDVGGINNLLALAGYDLDPTTGGSIYYSVEGTAPYRQLQLRYDDVTLAISPDHFIDVTTVLYESTNIIDLYVDKLPEVGAFGFVQGISNEDGSQYYYTKTTGTQVWFIGANDTAFRFTPTLCPRTIFDTIQVVGDITQNVLGNDTVFCFGESVELLSNTVSSYYLWNTDDTTQSITVNDEGYYTIELEYLSGCRILDTIFAEEIDSILLNITSTPCSIGETNGTATVEIFTGGLPPFTYFWSTGEETQTIENLSPGFYTVTVIDSLGCFVTDNVEVTFEIGVENFITNSINIYPNPAEGYFIIDVGNTFLNAPIELINIEGKIVYNSILKTNSTEMKIADFARGIYHLKISSGKNNYSQTVIIQ